MIMKRYLAEFFKTFGYPDPCSKQVSSCYDAIVSDADRNQILEELLAAYREDPCVSYFVLEEYVQRLCHGFAFHEYTVWLLIFVLMSRRLRELYSENGLSLSLWQECMSDLKTKTEECWTLYGIWGTFVASWFPNFYRLKRFSFGRLQIEITTFHNEDFVCKDGTVLRTDAPVLAVHIPKSQQPLSKENCDASYRAAAEFFGDRFEGDRVFFTCDSWMLYPETVRILHESSNTRRFAEDFELISQSKDPDGEYPSLWRIFDVAYDGDFSKLPEDSFIRRAFKEYLMNGGVMGRGYGVKILPKA